MFLLSAVMVFCAVEDFCLMFPVLTANCCVCVRVCAVCVCVKEEYVAFLTMMTTGEGNSFPGSFRKVLDAVDT
jgi:hypothetical protein